MKVSRFMAPKIPDSLSKLAILVTISVRLLYEPLTVTITHILNNKSGVSFSSYSHTGLPVAMFAHGMNAEQFNGYYDNTDIYNKLAAMLAVR